jgi:RNase P subunit RPR2
MAYPTEHATCKGCNSTNTFQLTLRNYVTGKVQSIETYCRDCEHVEVYVPNPERR